MLTKLPRPKFLPAGRIWDWDLTLSINHHHFLRVPVHGYVFIIAVITQQSRCCRTVAENGIFDHFVR